MQEELERSGFHGYTKEEEPRDEGGMFATKDQYRLVPGNGHEIIDPVSLSLFLPGAFSAVVLCSSDLK